VKLENGNELHLGEPCLRPLLGNPIRPILPLPCNACIVLLLRISHRFRTRLLLLSYAVLFRVSGETENSCGADTALLSECPIDSLSKSCLSR
jgi:hypothetical protein